MERYMHRWLPPPPTFGLRHEEVDEERHADDEHPPLVSGTKQQRGPTTPTFGLRHEEVDEEHHADDELPPLVSGTKQQRGPTKPTFGLRHEEVHEERHADDERAEEEEGAPLELAQHGQVGLPDHEAEGQVDQRRNALPGAARLQRLDLTAKDNL